MSSLEEYGKIYTSYKIYYEIKKGDIEMKKLFSVVVSVVMILSLCACGGKQDDSSVSSSETNMDDTSEHSGISVDNSSAASPLRKGWVRRTFCQKYSLNYFQNYDIIET